MATVFGVCRSHSISVVGTSATFVRLAASSEVHSEADISRITDPATLMSTRPRMIAEARLRIPRQLLIPRVVLSKEGH